MDRDRATAGVLALAERIGARVFSSALASRCGFPEDHPLFAGSLPRIRTGVVDRLHGHDVIVVLGAPVFNYHISADGPYIPAGSTLFQLTDDSNAASYAAVGTSIITTLGPAIERLLPLLDAAPPRRPAPAAHARERIAPSDPIGVEYLLQAVAATLPPDALIAEEAPTTHTFLHDYLPMRAGRYFAAASGSLGYGLPAAVGVALAAPGTRVVALIGDGSSYYAFQGLWTAVEHRLPIAFVIVNNGGYGAMRSFSQLLGSQRSPSFDIGHCDVVALARGFGCPGARVTRAADLEPALLEAYRSDGPVLIDVTVESAPKKLF